MIMLEINKVHCGDCLELMREITDRSIDMVIADLPYGTTNLSWDTCIDLDKFWPLIRRICKKEALIIMTAQQPFATDLINSNRKNFAYELIWEKTMALGFLSANKRPMRLHENILIFRNGGKSVYNPQKKKAKQGMNGRRGSRSENHHYATQYIGKGHSNNGEHFPDSILKFSNGHAGKSNHPTEKPVPLFEYLIRTFSNYGDIILDPVSGAGSTAIACLKSHRNFICIDKTQEYCELVERRINEMPPNLFEELESPRMNGVQDFLFEDRELISDIPLLGDSTL